MARGGARRIKGPVREVISRFDGHIAQYLGDGLLVYFGYPSAHEDDAQRAVRAGLGIVEAIQHAPLLQPWRASAPRHSHRLVVVGEMGSREARTVSLGRHPQYRGSPARTRGAEYGSRQRRHAAADRRLL